MHRWDRIQSQTRYLLIRVGFSALIAIAVTGGAVLADEIRVVDTRGLVRAVKITRGSARIVVTLETRAGSAVTGECVATNVDGLAAEKRVAISTKSECTFTEVRGGSWQIAVPQGYMWWVQLYE